MKNALLIIAIMLCLPLSAQRWQDENRGLYPNTLQLSANIRNTSLGVYYGYLFQKPFYGVPVGMYGSFMQTIKPDHRYINYPWERKYSLGLSITLPHTLESGLAHTMATVGLIYNEHPREWENASLNPGQYTGDIYCTNHIGCELGIRMQYGHFSAHLKADIVNWMRYVEFGGGYCFSLQGLRR